MGVKYAKMIFNFEDSDVMAAGDSGNDIDMLKGPYWGIVVANYEESLGMWLRKKDRKHLILAERMFADAIIECIEKIHNDY